MDSSLSKRTINSVAWTYLSYGLSKGVILVTTAVLTRLLTKADFGIVGFAITAMSFLDAVRDLGLGLALIQRRDRIEEAADTVFWISLGSNTIIWLLSFLIAPFVADFFHEPEITTILPVLAFSFVLSSLGGTHDALLQRDLRFSRRIIPAGGESLTKGVVSISMALTGWGVWALVIGQLVGRGTFSLLAWRVVEWRPRFRFVGGLAKEMLGFGSRISLDSLLSTLQANIDYVFIGRFLGETALGVYTIAFRIPELVIINLCIVIAQVLFPAYAMLQENRDQLRQSMLVTLRYIALVTVPAGVGLALISHVFTTTIFGSDWADAAPIMAALSIYGSLLAVSWNVGDVYKAIGRPDILWKTSVVEFGMLAPVLYMLAKISPFAVSLGHVSVAFAIGVLRLAIAVRLLDLSVRKTLSQFIPSVSGSVVMGLMVWGTLRLTAPLPDAITLALAVLVGLASYSGALWWLERDLVQGIIQRLRQNRQDEEEALTDALVTESMESIVSSKEDLVPTRIKATGDGQRTRLTEIGMQISRFSLQSSAQVIMLSRPGELLSETSRLPAHVVLDLFKLVDSAWSTSPPESNALSRFVRFPDAQEYLLYSVRFKNETRLSMIFYANIPIRTARAQIIRLTNILVATVHDTNSITPA